MFFFACVHTWKKCHLNFYRFGKIEDFFILRECFADQNICRCREVLGEFFCEALSILLFNVAAWLQLGIDGISGNGLNTQ